MTKRELLEENSILRTENKILLKRIITIGDRMQTLSDNILILTNKQLQNERSISCLSNERRNLKKMRKENLDIIATLKARINELEEIIEEDTIMGLPA
jgi:uncharacterized protein involved in exopolysaccharide biosynthesis